MRTIRLVSTGWLILIGAIGAVAIARYCAIGDDARPMAIGLLGMVTGAALLFVGYREP